MHDDVRKMHDPVKPLTDRVHAACRIDDIMDRGMWPVRHRRDCVCKYSAGQSGRAQSIVETADKAHSSAGFWKASVGLSEGQITATII